MTLGAGRDHESEATGAIGGGGGREERFGGASESSDSDRESNRVRARKIARKREKVKELIRGDEIVRRLNA